MSNTNAPSKTAELVPYIFFYGRCEEALEFYKQVLGGSYDVMRVGDSPMKDQMPPESHGAVMHATFTAPGFSFMASDGSGKKAIDPNAGNISLSLALPSPEEGARMYDALAEGGKATMPFAEVPWGGKFGTLVDRFGNEWFITG